MVTGTRENPVKTLPSKYQAYFDDHFGKGRNDKAHTFCCQSLERVSTVEDEEIGNQLAELARLAFQDRDPLTDAEDSALRSWPSHQLRVFREGLLAIFGDPEGCPDTAVRRGRFKGKTGRKRRSLTVRVEDDRVEITFRGP
jgi:hypothetical protein